MRTNRLKHLFEYRTPFHVDPLDLVGHTLILGPTRLGMSCLPMISKFTEITERQAKGLPGCSHQLRCMQR